mmetsp:Transcript_33733/g.49580  ORF Transcript_33733/g.49580 Transcript_33733/m.49580 type:complete len:82 (+) Transcript_33733:369-614(+)
MIKPPPLHDLKNCKRTKSFQVRKHFHNNLTKIIKLSSFVLILTCVNIERLCIYCEKVTQDQEKCNIGTRVSNNLECTPSYL